MLKILLCASLFGAAACADDPTSDRSPPVGGVTDPRVSNPEGGNGDAPNVQALAAQEAQCLSDGPCSPACSAGMVIDLHVPEGNCVTFDCSGEGGSSDLGGCHP